jgi:hypothetical protein
MSKKPHTTADTDAPLRGHAAWLAEKQRIADNNEKAYAQARARRDVRVADIHRNAREIERRQDAHLPTQPTPPGA